MSLERIIKQNVITVNEDKPITDVACIMRDHSIGDVVVVDNNGKPKGLLTDRDIVTVAVADKLDELPRMTVRELMSSDVVCASISDMPLDVAIKMRDHGVSRMPVLDADGNLCGIVTSNHLLRQVHEEVMALAGISQRHKESDAIATEMKPRPQTDMPDLMQPILQ